ncbi:MAG TPA: helix-turn-helix transcriptional regulator [Candidatus Elarobacter sp.]|jgi:transcriptional regulator with XRE-family HTH domain|nr:helix-turn-helix transcriptional regulator [Candidatus Elarobacter sp.]
MTIGQRIHAARIAVGLSQGQVAERVGIAQAAISRIERDETHDPGVLIVAGIARALGITVDELVKGNVRKRTAQYLMASRIDELEARVAALEERLAANPPLPGISPSQW